MAAGVCRDAGQDRGASRRDGDDDVRQDGFVIIGRHPERDAKGCSLSYLLVTNDFPPKVGGIQSYLWELWRRLPPERTTVLTTSHDGDRAFDAAQPFRIERTRERVLLPTPALRRRIDRLATEVEAPVVIMDPALPLGVLGRSLERPYVLVVHGAEITVPARIPGSAPVLRWILEGAVHIIAAGSFPAAETCRAAGRDLPVTVIPPGVDVEHFHPPAPEEREQVRAAFGLDSHGPLVVSVGRLVRRKGVDVVISAAAGLASAHPGLTVAIAGTGRDHPRLQRLAARTKAPVRFLGPVAYEHLPALYGCGDVFAAPCRTRWRGLEQEGFGIVFLEAAACGVPQVAGDSGGAAEAVLDGETGVVVRRPGDAQAVAAALDTFLANDDLTAHLGRAARERAVTHFSYPALATRLVSCLDTLSDRAKE